LPGRKGRISFRALLCAAFALLGGGFARAQTGYGPGGLFIHPTALTPPKGSALLNASYFTLKADDDTSTWIPVSVTYSPTDASQIGALYVGQPGEKNSWGAFGKYQLMRDTLATPAVSIVGSYLNGDIQQSSVAGVVSHDFRVLGRSLVMVHAGVQWARRADIADAQSDVSFFAGGQLPLKGGWYLVGEAGTKFKFDRRPATALGFMWHGPLGTVVGIGWVNEGRSEDNRFFVGVGYRIGGNR
jgi:hypothetical protein